MGVRNVIQAQADRLDELVRMLSAYVPTEADAALVRRAEMERAEFLRRFPAETIADLTPAAYCIGHGDRDNFCWWIERGTNALSRYFPGSSRHYGLYWEKKSNWRPVSDTGRQFAPARFQRFVEGASRICLR